MATRTRPLGASLLCLFVAHLLIAMATGEKVGRHSTHFRQGNDPAAVETVIRDKDSPKEMNNGTTNSTVKIEKKPDSTVLERGRVDAQAIADKEALAKARTTKEAKRAAKKKGHRVDIELDHTGMSLPNHNLTTEALIQSEAESETGWGRCYDATPGGGRGWKVCGNGYYVTGFQRGGCDWLHCIRMRCCKPDAHQAQSWGYCYNENVWSSMDRAGWNGCRRGTYISGYYKTHGNNLYNLEEFKCCKPQSAANYWQTCYHANWWAAFDRNWRWGNCGSQYYATHIWKNWCEPFHCLEMGHCCQMPQLCHRQLTCKHGGSQARSYGPPCYCRCHGIWYGRDCGLELQRDCNRGWIPGMPRWSPAGSLNAEIQGYFKKEAETRNIPLVCMIAAHARSLSRFPGISDIQHKIRKLASRQGRTNHCVAQSVSSGVGKASRAIPLKVAAHLGIREEEVIDECQTKERRMKMLINIYMMPGEDANLFAQARSFYELTQEMPWERLYRLRKGHQQHLLMSINHEDRNLHGFSEHMKQTHKRGKGQRTKVGNVEKQMAKSYNSITQSLAFAKYRGHVHEHLQTKLDETTKWIDKFNKKAHELGVRAQKDFHREDRVMMKDNAHVHKELSKMEHAETENIRKMITKLRKANASFYAKTAKPVHQALFQLVKFILSRAKLRWKHRAHLRKLMWDLKKEKFLFKWEIHEHIRQERKRSKERLEQTTTAALKKSLQDIKKNYVNHKRQLALSISRMQETVNRTSKMNKRFLSLLKSIMKDESGTLTSVKEQTNTLGVTATNAYNRMTKDYTDIGVEVNNKVKNAENDKKQLKDLEKNMFRTMAEQEDELMKRESKNQDNDKFEENTIKELDEVKTLVDNQMKKVTGLEERLLSSAKLYHGVEGDLKEKSLNAFNTVVNVEDKVDALQKRVPYPEQVKVEDEIRIQHQEEECEKDADAAAAIKAKSSAENEIEAKKEDVINSSQIGAVVGGSCKQKDKASKGEDVLKDIGDSHGTEMHKLEKVETPEEQAARLTANLPKSSPSTGPPGGIENLYGE